MNAQDCDSSVTRNPTVKMSEELKWKWQNPGFADESMITCKIMTA
jgi:hypothetical protein